MRGRLLLLLAAALVAVAARAGPPGYETRADHDPEGIGKFYFGREIAQTMGPGGIPWLDRPERDAEERPGIVLAAMDLKPGEVVADLGAGSGYFSFKIAPELLPDGKVLAVEIQDEMLDRIRARAAATHAPNVEAVKGTEADPKLPENGVDTVLMVDVYHELADPLEVMRRVVASLKPAGRVVFVEYRQEDPSIPIKALHKMALAQLDTEMDAVGLTRIRTIETLPAQHIAIYARRK